MAHSNLGKLSGEVLTASEVNELLTVDIDGNAEVESLTESVVGAGVTIEAVTIKDGLVDGVLIKDGLVDGVDIAARDADLSTVELVSDIQGKANGVQLIQSGAIYTFDDWDATDILTGSNAWPVPYKKALSNVFTGFEVQTWEGLAGKRLITILSGLGLQWTKDRTSTGDNRLGSILRGDETTWESNTNAAELNSGTNTYRFKEFGYTVGANADLNGLGNEYVSWNWSYPCAKAWHANGATSRKVSTPWGTKDSVESNASSGLTGDQIILELYHPLTGNGCLLYIGNASNRVLDHSAGVTPEFMIAKTLSDLGRGAIYHKSLNGGTSPEDYIIYLDIADAEILLSTFLNGSLSASTIQVGASDVINKSGALQILHYFSPLIGLQAFGGYAGTGAAHTRATGCKDGMYGTKLRLGGTGSWAIVDYLRGDSNAVYWDLTNAESIENIAFNTTTGMDITGTGGNANASGDDYIDWHFGKEVVIQGNIDKYPTDGVEGNGTNNSIKVTFEYEGAGALNSELLLYVSRVASPDWTLGSMSQLATLSGSKKLITATVDVSAQVAGDELRWRFVTSETPYTEHNISNLKIIGV